jgi:hypothetical protein
MYQVRNGPTGKPMHFRLHDTRGLEADQGIDNQEISYIVDGNLPDRHQVLVMHVNFDHPSNLIATDCELRCSGKVSSSCST